ncbi:MAG: bifunctional diguanylate cyclase/phosphodiesterase [Gammaproteobacteria bacterium]
MADRDNTEQSRRRAAELVIANLELASLNEEKAKRAAELAVANLELAFQQDEKAKRAAELVVANKELAYQSDERDRLAAELHHLAFYDPLTRIANRRLLLDRLSSAQDIAARSGRVGAVLYIDLDDFKDINDTLGQAIGDLLLRQVAWRLETCVGPGDTVARISADEFVVVLAALGKHPLEAARRARSIGDRIRSALSVPYQLESHDYTITSSIGAALFSDAESAEALLQRADIAMVEAKQAGGDALKFFDQAMQDVISARVALEAELEAALEHEEFVLHFQPLVDVSGRMRGAEVLIRWMHPERGLVMPGAFIDVAETTQLVVPIDAWVLDQACAQLSLWQQRPETRDLSISVNISAQQFGTERFVEEVREMVKKHGITPHGLTLEITENMLLTDFTQTTAHMAALKEIGVRISLDDFGTGYSSLQYLKRLPIDELKVDMMFVQEITTDVRDQAIVRAIVALAHSLGLTVVAEGVETDAQRQILIDVGCDHLQGYFYARPGPVEALPI